MIAYLAFLVISLAALGWVVVNGERIMWGFSGGHDRYGPLKKDTPS